MTKLVKEIKITYTLDTEDLEFKEMLSNGASLRGVSEDQIIKEAMDCLLQGTKETIDGEFEELIPGFTYTVEEI